MTIDTIPFDVASTLDSDEMIQEYFSQVIEDGDSEEIVRALCHIARARGMNELAAKTELERDGLCKTFDAIIPLIRDLGLRLSRPCNSTLSA